MSGRSAPWVRFTGVWVVLVAVLAVAVLTVACGQAAPAPTAVPKPAETAKPAAGAPAPTAAPAVKKVDYPTKTVTMISPSTPGSGFDTMARAVTAAIEKENLLPSGIGIPVKNYSGTVEGMSVIAQQHKGDPNMVAINSVACLMSTAAGSSPYGLKDITPIANIAGSFYGIAVRDDSPYKALPELLKDLKEKPDATPISGGRSDDIIALGAIGGAYGFDPKKVNYAALAGSENKTIVLEGTSKAVLTSVDELTGLVEAKKLRLLGTSGAKRVRADVPTFKEAGVNLEWLNFRYLVGGPGMPDYAVAYWKDLLGKMVKTPTWKDTLTKLSFSDEFLVGGFDKYLADRAAVIDKVTNEMGLAQPKK